MNGYAEIVTSNVEAAPSKPSCAVTWSFEPIISITPAGISRFAASIQLGRCSELAGSLSETASTRSPQTEGESRDHFSGSIAVRLVTARWRNLTTVNGIGLVGWKFNYLWSSHLAPNKQRNEHGGPQSRSQWWCRSCCCSVLCLGSSLLRPIAEAHVTLEERSPFPAAQFGRAESATIRDWGGQIGNQSGRQASNSLVQLVYEVCHVS
jgi:hypothetical protein